MSLRQRRRGRGTRKEVSVPAYKALQEGERTGARMLEILLRGVSTRNDQRVLPEMAATVGVTRSSVSREAIQAVFGADHPVQLYRTHKLRNVLERLPEEQKDQVRAAMRAAWRLEAKAGIGQREKLAQ